MGKKIKAGNKTGATGVIAVCWMAVLVGCPLVYVFVVSFLTRGETGSVVFSFTLANYAKVFEPVNLKIFAVSLGTALLTAAISLIISYPFSYFTAMLNKKIRFFVILVVMIDRKSTRLNSSH